MKVLELFLNKFNIEIKQNESVIGNFSYILWDNNRYKICGSGNYENEIKDKIFEYLTVEYNYDKIALKNMYIIENIKYCKSIIEKQEEDIKKLRKQYLLGNVELEVLKDFCHKFGYTFIIKDKNKYEIENEKLNKCLALQNIYLENLGYEISCIINLYLMDDNFNRETIYYEFLNLAKRKGVIK